MDDRTRLDLKVPDVAPSRRSAPRPTDITKPRHRAPDPGRTGLRVVGLMLAALVLSAVGLCIAVAGWLGYGAPVLARSVSCGAGVMLMFPVPMVGFWVTIRRVLR